MTDIEIYNKYLHNQKFITNINDDVICTFCGIEKTLYDNINVRIRWRKNNQEQSVEMALENVIMYINNKEWLTLSYLRKEKLKKLKND